MCKWLLSAARRLCGAVVLCRCVVAGSAIVDVHAAVRMLSAFLCCSSRLCRRKQEIGVFRCGGRSLTRTFLVGEKGQCTVRVCAVDLRKSLQEDEHQCPDWGHYAIRQGV